MLLKANNLEKCYGTKKILSVKKLEIFSDDKIGLIGMNGAGKSTLLKILFGDEKPDSGIVSHFCKISMIKQNRENDGNPDGQKASLFNLKSSALKSGGEKTRLSIASALSKNSNLLFADEPTANLDIEGIKIFENELMAFKGAFVLVSHDRELIEKTCNTIWEIDKGSLRIFSGKLSQFEEQKNNERENQSKEYIKYTKKKHELESALNEIKTHAAKMSHIPKGIGSKEARVSFLKAEHSIKKVQNSASAVKKRISMLEEVEKPENITNINIFMGPSESVGGKIMVSANNFSFGFNNKSLFNNVSFSIKTGRRTVIMGPNGCGKSTLASLILKNSMGFKTDGLKTHPKIKAGLFSQESETIDISKTPLENMKFVSSKKESELRTILACLLFSKEDIFKPASLLSGGERARLKLAMLMASDLNTIILDEPTNYIDFYTSKALEKLILKYSGTVIIITHDIAFAKNVGENFIFIKNGKVEMFEGTLDQYETKEKPAKYNQNLSLEKTIIEMELSNLSSKIQNASGSEKDQLQKRIDETIKKYIKIKELLKNV